ncbi:MAG TPA: phospholipase D family protein [Terriglobales bacterium]|nr:phospholipase D family protein [Terriglobales bacterium]
MNSKPVFLGSPPEIRQAICALAAQSSRLDMAAAFVGADWWERLANYGGKMRVICWLTSTNTNPDAVAEMRSRSGVIVKQRNSMHAKVYLAPGIGAVVGSANLSKAALADEQDIAGQNEAAVLVRDSSVVSSISAWFEDLWRDKLTRAITDEDLERARIARKKAQRGDRKRPRPGFAMQLPRTLKTESTFRRLEKWAKQVRGLDLARSLGEHHNFFACLVPATLSESQRNNLIRLLTKYVKHRTAYRRFDREPLERARKGLTLLFDEGEDLQHRLEELDRLNLLPGMKVPSLSLLLYWREPRRYVPYNQKTQNFMEDFGLKRRGLSAASPKCYANWLGYATRLQQRLRLPFPGHLDRMITRYLDFALGR